MNSITVHAASSKLNPYNISIETTDIISNELGDLEDILQSIANEEKELRGGR